MGRLIFDEYWLRIWLRDNLFVRVRGERVELYLKCDPVPFAVADLPPPPEPVDSYRY
jgi:hypothetical protein